ncbi:hypothetical protein AXG93_93s1320 [Marchantia polymorpha subsp. ruderalis]|uniref:Reverse transcriptase RNase H-like domain-containing protein n=1 Tax=Marchantia polymorpha subsp. ruderalis TaxID=1480154 RepID=A0A176WTW8_MARPO|nr:hypothetical protein AXG93_93s1320 [Marchantia polymorpha subsp. ruderalis]
MARFRCYLFGTQFTLVIDYQQFKWLMESNKLTWKFARWALILPEYDFHVVHRLGVANLDADGLSRNPCTSQQDDTGARWHGEVDEEMMPGWHASDFLCLLRGDSSREDHLTSYFSQRMDDKSSDHEVDNDATDQRDIHDDALVLEFLRTSMVPCIVGVNERDRILQRTKRYRLEGAHVLRMWEDSVIRLVLLPAQRARIVRHAHEELEHFEVKRTYNLLLGQYWWCDDEESVVQAWPTAETSWGLEY